MPIIKSAWLPFTDAPCVSCVSVSVCLPVFLPCIFGRDGGPSRRETPWNGVRLFEPPRNSFFYPFFTTMMEGSIN